jgi:hypothetical protein
MGRTLLRILKIICYVALGALLAGFAVLAFLGVLDICPRLDEGGISCVSPVFEVIASIAMAIVLLSVFMGLPALLALGGLIFLAFDLLRRGASDGGNCPLALPTHTRGSGRLDLAADGTFTHASPSSTISSPTLQLQASRARWRSGINSATVTVTST